MRRRSTGRVVGTVSIAVVAAACQAARAAPAVEPGAAAAISVRLAEVEHRALAQTLRAAGTLHLKAEADLAFKVGGVVTQVSADAGQRVKKGQLLAVIDRTELLAADSQAAQAVDKATRDRERAQKLSESGAIGSVEVQNAETALALALASADAAAFNLRHASLIAPDDGVLDRRSVEVGEIVPAGRPIFHLSGVSRGMVVRVQLADRQALQLRRGARARVTLDAKPGLGLSAQVAQIASSASPGTGTLEVELRLDDPPLGLPSGLIAKVEIETDGQASSSVPLAALVDGQGQDAAVFIVDGDRARRVPVRVSFLSGDRAALANGLEQTEHVIDLGAALLADGSLVRIAP